MKIPTTSSLVKPFIFWKEKMHKQKGVTFLLLLLLISVLFISFYKNNLIHAITYLGVIVAGAYIIEWYVQTWKPHDEGIVIKKPGREIRVLIIIIIAQVVVSVTRFSLFPDWAHAPAVIRIAALVVMVTFIYPLFLIIYIFPINRYKPSEVGIRLRSNVWIAVPVIVLTALAAYTFIPHKIQWIEVLNEMGIAQLLFLGFISAAIPEEFMRFFCQTRLGYALRSTAWGWLITSLIWAAIHIPNFSSQSDLLGGTLSALGIVPIGLLWGYMTYRLKNIWPSVLYHGTNLWGIQNVI